MTILTVRPLDRYPNAETKYRKDSPFKAAWSTTTTLLDRELWMLKAKNAVLLMDVSERDCRIDGWIRADARPASPRVVLAFDSEYGPLKYSCDRFYDWRDNVRAIALGLEALRKLERYGITSRGEQYTGWNALGAGIPMGAAPMSVEEAAGLLEAEADEAGLMTIAAALIDDADARDRAYRRAAKVLHPDVGGDPERFKRLTEARDLLAAH